MKKESKVKMREREEREKKNREREREREDERSFKKTNIEGLNSKTKLEKQERVEKNI
jgi:hypothetical protein